MYFQAWLGVFVLATWAMRWFFKTGHIWIPCIYWEDCHYFPTISASSVKLTHCIHYRRNHLAICRVLPWECKLGNIHHNSIVVDHHSKTFHLLASQCIVTLWFWPWQRLFGKHILFPVTCILTRYISVTPIWPPHWQKSGRVPNAWGWNWCCWKVTAILLAFGLHQCPGWSINSA